MQYQEGNPIADSLKGAVAAGASSDEVAALVAAMLRGIDRALAPIVGERGVAALYTRSLHLARAMHSGLPASTQGSEFEVDVAALTAALAAQGSEDAAAAGTNLLQGLVTLLVSLIGQSLTERLLRPVWVKFLSEPSDRDTNS
ncbi:MAG: hypothetical protein ABIN44_08260 [Burkholderiaceae bacterium]